MANPQAQANGEQKTTATKASKAKKQRREPSLLTWWWRFFWMRRSGARTVWALILAIPTLLMIVYLALSASDQTQVVAAIQAAAQIVGQTLGPTGLRVGMEIAMVVFALASMALLLAPGYRQYRYLHLPTSVIPRSTVLLDFENMASNPLGKHLLELMLEHLKTEVLAYHDFTQRRVDLLYFMNARHLTNEKIPEGIEKAERTNWSATTRRLNDGYNELYLNGFQLVNSPHKIIPSQGKMNEAVDRAIELFAFERALLGGFKQEFVIISGDGDYAPLIYRLVALGHTVQMWMWGETEVYNELEKRIPLKVVPLLPPYMENLYDAIDKTVELCKSIGERQVTVDEKLRLLQNSLNSKMRLIFSKIGFSAKGYGFYGLSWRRILYAVDALRKTESGFPERGSTDALVAARRLYAMALAGAQAAVRAALDNPAEPISMSFILAQLVASDLAKGDAMALQTLLSEERNKSEPDMCEVDTFFLTHCAHALDLLLFDDVPNSHDLIRNPRLTDLAKRTISENAGQPA